jgi:hypothetical protein
MSVFNFLFTSYVQYNFDMHMSRVTSSHFAKYFCDIYSEYITSCAVMIYATSDDIWAMPPRVRILRSGATVYSDWVDNTMNSSLEEIG